MKNNNGRGLYEIGKVSTLSCGCVEVAEEIGYSLYVNPSCPFDNRFHAPIKNYRYRIWDQRPLCATIQEKKEEIEK